MIIYLGKNSVYKINDDFPIFRIPVEMEGAVTQSLSDFQWWAYSSDFEKWLKENPREWTADSEDMSKYGSPLDFIKESLRSEFISNDIKEGVLGFDDYHNDLLLEQDEQNDAGQAIKFHYAYNKLLSENKIEKEFIVANQKQGVERAVFLTLDDPETKSEVFETLTAYKLTALPVSSNSKMALFKLSETLPGGPVPDDETNDGLLKRAAETTFKVAAISGIGLGIYQILSVAGSVFVARRAYKYLDKLLPSSRVTQQTQQASNAISWLTKSKNAAKGFIGKRLNPLRYGKGVKQAGQFWKGVGKSLERGASGAYKTVTKGKGGASAAVKAFGKGAGRGLSKLTAKGAVDWIPVIGWTLAAIDVVGSTWNWFSDKQAPRFSEVESFAKDQFSPKSIPIGIPITICWSQEAGGAWGTIVNFIANNDTRTTMELVKVSDINGKSIFIVTQINSKELGKQLAEHELTLISFDSSANVKTGVLDNDDLDFEMVAIDGLNKIASVYNFKGVCDWTETYTTYEASSTQLFIADPGAPKKYEFYFEDSEGEVINVSGDLIDDDQLEKLSDSDLLKHFGTTASAQNESETVSWNRDILESEKILNFENFVSSTSLVKEEDEAAKDSDVDYDLKPSQKTAPVKVAIYKVTEREYANPELRGKYETGDFQSFVVDQEYWDASEGSKIEVEINTPEILEDTIRGIYTYKSEGKRKEVKDEEPTEVKTATKKEGAERDDDSEKGKKLPDDYYIVANPDDISIKQRERSTTIRDTNYSGGLNLFDKFLTPRQKEILGVDKWKTITFAKEFYDKRGDIIEVKLKNKYAPFGEKSRKYRVTDGESFEIAKKFVEETKDRIKYE
jgi:hypothetical protein